MKTFESKINENIPSLVAFIHADSSEAEAVDSLLRELNEKYGTRINTMRIDASFDHRLKKQYDILKYPTWILFREGQELMRESGMKNLNELSQLVDRGF